MTDLDKILSGADIRREYFAKRNAGEEWLLWVAEELQRRLMHCRLQVRDLLAEIKEENGNEWN